LIKAYLPTFSLTVMLIRATELPMLFAVMLNSA
jgi:hypothetical protein